MILINKPRGLTPLQALDRLRELHPELNKSKLAYAGRLDPQAQGLLLVLQDQECFERDKYQDLDKTYEFELLLGVTTDTGDIMGIPQLGNISIEITEQDITTKLPIFTGKIAQNYPAYSSKTVNGEKLFKFAQRGEFPKIEHLVEVNKLTILANYTLNSEEVLEVIHKNIKRVTGEFRQPEIMLNWSKLLNDLPAHKCQVFRFNADVGSGTYIRQLCIDIGEMLGSKGLAFSITRNRIGQFDLKNVIELE